jgi:hypothetical protein
MEIHRLCLTYMLRTDQHKIYSVTMSGGTYKVMVALTGREQRE